MTKDKVLKLLLDHQGQSLSGQAMADQLGLSRNSIWKAVKQLQDQGYDIISQAGQGYHLQAVSQTIDPTLVSYGLHTFWDDLQFKTFDTVGSTNDEARLAIEQDRHHKHLILAKQQNRGRGRRGRSFHSHLDHGIYMSLAFRPTQASSSDIPLYTLLAAVALIESLQDYVSQPLQVKWVNDVFYKGKKIIGILSEMVTHMENQHIPHVVIGMGINLAGSFDQAPAFIQDVAGTLFGLDLPQHFNVNEWLVKCLNRFAYYEQHFQDKAFLNVYRNHMLGIDQAIRFQVNGQEKKAILRGINDQGHLIVENELGQKECLYGQDIHFSSRQFIENLQENEAGTKVPK